jgi:uncharacterized membrane protein YecN with MAPEG domain
MPNYKGHLAGGVVTFCILILTILGCFSQSINLHQIMQYFASCLIGSLFPDIDTKSKIQKKFYTILLLLFIITLAQNNFLIFSALSFIGLLPLIVHHRGLFHKPLFIVTVGLFFVLICHMYIPCITNNIYINILFFVFGAFSHIILDVGIKRFFRI